MATEMDRQTETDVKQSNKESEQGNGCQKSPHPIPSFHTWRNRGPGWGTMGFHTATRDKLTIEPGLGDHGVLPGHAGLQSASPALVLVMGWGRMGFS